MLEARDYRPIVDAVPNLVATKNTGGGHTRAAELVSQVGELQHFLGEGNFLQGSLYGECSLLATFGSLNPHRVKAYLAAAQAKDYPRMLEFQRGFHDLLADLFKILTGESKIDGAYDKLWVRLGGFKDMPLRLLSPYHGFSEAQYHACKSMLESKYADWLTPKCMAAAARRPIRRAFDPIRRWHFSRHSSGKSRRRRESSLSLAGR